MVPWSLLVKDVPKEKHQDLDFIIEQLDWEKNVDTHFKEHNYLEPIVDPARSGSGYTDRWIVYGTVDGEQLFSAKELTVEPGAKCTLKDPGASGWITVQGSGRIGKLKLQTPAMIHFGEETEDEVFISYEAATAGVEVENTGERAAGRPALFRPRRPKAAERRRLQEGLSGRCLRGLSQFRLRGLSQSCARRSGTVPLPPANASRYQTPPSTTPRQGPRAWPAIRTISPSSTMRPGRASSAKGPTPSRRSIWTRCST